MALAVLGALATPVLLPACTPRIPSGVLRCTRDSDCPAQFQCRRADFTLPRRCYPSAGTATDARTPAVGGASGAAGTEAHAGAAGSGNNDLSPLQVTGGLIIIQGPAQPNTTSFRVTQQSLEHQPRRCAMIQGDALCVIGSLSP